MYFSIKLTAVFFLSRKRIKPEFFLLLQIIFFDPFNDKLFFKSPKSNFSSIKKINQRCCFCCFCCFCDQSSLTHWNFFFFIFLMDAARNEGSVKSGSIVKFYFCNNIFIFFGPSINEAASIFGLRQPSADWPAGPAAGWPPTRPWPRGCRRWTLKLRQRSWVRRISDARNFTMNFLGSLLD